MITLEVETSLIFSYRLFVTESAFNIQFQYLVLPSALVTQLYDYIF